MNTYSGVPDDLGERMTTIQTKALAIDIERAISHLKDGQGGQFEAVIWLLGAMIGYEEGER